MSELFQHQSFKVLDFEIIQKLQVLFINKIIMQKLKITNCNKYISARIPSISILASFVASTLLVQIHYYKTKKSSLCHSCLNRTFQNPEVPVTVNISSGFWKILFLQKTELTYKVEQRKGLRQTGIDLENKNNSIYSLEFPLESNPIDPKKIVILNLLFVTYTFLICQKSRSF